MQILSEGLRQKKQEGWQNFMELPELGEVGMWQHQIYMSKTSLCLFKTFNMINLCGKPYLSFS